MGETRCGWRALTPMSVNRAGRWSLSPGTLLVVMVASMVGWRDDEAAPSSPFAIQGSPEEPTPSRQKKRVANQLVSKRHDGQPPGRNKVTPT